MAAANNSSICTSLNTLVLTAPEEASAWLYTQWETIFYLSLFISIFTIGVINNFVFFYMLARVPRMQTVVNMYLAHLAVADTVSLVVNIIYYAFGILNSPIKENLPFRFKYTCVLMYGPAFLTYYASVVIITLVTFDRYLAVCFPIRHRLLKPKRLAVKALSVTWLLSIIPATFSTLRFARQAELCIKWPRRDFYQNLPQTMSLCIPLVPDTDINLIGMNVFLVFGFVIMLVNIIMYGGIITALNPKNRTGTMGTGTTMTRETLVRNQVARMLVIAGTFFFIFQLPLRCYTIGNIVRILGGKPVLSSRQHYMLVVIGRISLLINSSTNSFIYGFTSEYYRKCFFEAFRRRSVTNHANRRPKRVKTSSVSGRLAALRR
ncbi:galanin receptor 2a-like [Amphiura filiformis]|uniref:galanin receptor 2a-like n=1 Tax=Amphiura filiformis TaxID=82378 RepID=UPI003B21F17D